MRASRSTASLVEGLTLMVTLLPPVLALLPVLLLVLGRAARDRTRSRAALKDL